MNHNLASILQQLSAIHFEEIEGSFTTQELWEWVFFDENNNLLNKSLQIHQPSGIPIKGRNTDLDKNITIKGNYYCFTYIGHQPSYHLQRVKYPDDLANLLLSKEGLLNSFTTVMIPIISGQVVPVLAKQVQMQLATELINEMQQIISCFHGTNFNELTKTGHSCLVKFKKMGLSQQDAYNAVYFIAQVYQTLQIDAKNDLADEFLDYISGYIGNKKCWVWSKPLK